jgi:glycosyltransferase involved in cell wall biosynthesis
MKMLAHFDRVFAVSAASRDELTAFWRWQGVTPRGEVEVLPLGADFDGGPRAAGRTVPPAPVLLTVGILEPRKNQLFLLERCAELWREGLGFELHLVGRLNPHFGPPILARLKALQRDHLGLVYHAAASDARVTDLYARARASVFATRAEGCGLPLLESLWRGVPCLCTDLPVLQENAAGGGCLTAPLDDAATWREALRRLLTDDALMGRLTAEAQSRALPRWTHTADRLRRRLLP